MKAVWILLAVWWMFAQTVTCQSSEDQIEQFFRDGQQALKQQDFEHAVLAFKKVAALDPTLVEAQVNLGLAYQGLYEYDLAASYLAKAVHERPNLLGPSVIAGMDYLKLGSPEKAIPFLQHALKLDPSNVDAHQALASAYLDQENFRGAAEQFRKIADLAPDKSGAWFKLGHEYLDLAARLAYRGAHLYRESAWGHRFLGDLLLQRGRWQDALKEYEKALSADPQQPGLHTSMGQAYLQAQKLEDSEKEFRRELQVDPRAERAWLGLANLELFKGEPAAAVKSLQKIWEISPEFLAVQRDFPTVELPPQSLKTSISALQGEGEGTPVKCFALAGLFAANNENSAADREWKSFQTGFAAWQQASQAATRTVGDPCKFHSYSRCIDSLAARKHLTDSDRVLLGKTHFTLQQYEAAANVLAEVQGATRENAESSYWLERTYQAEGAETYARLQESFPDSWRTHQLRAESAALHQDLDGAQKEFEAALQLRPNEPELHEALGELYFGRQMTDDAGRELETALSLDPSRTHALYLLGRLYLQKRDNEKALTYLQRALRLQPDLGEASRLLGTLYVHMGQYANAVSILEKAAPSDHYGNVHYQLYLAYRKLGRNELAQKELQRSEDLRRSSLEHDQALVMGSSQPEN